MKVKVRFFECLLFVKKNDLYIPVFEMKYNAEPVERHTHIAVVSDVVVALDSVISVDEHVVSEI